MQNFFTLVNQEARLKRNDYSLSKADFFTWVSQVEAEEDDNYSPLGEPVPKVAPAAAGCLHNCTRRRESATPSILPARVPREGVGHRQTG